MREDEHEGEGGGRGPLFLGTDVVGLSVGDRRCCRPCGRYLATSGAGTASETTNAALAAEGRGYACDACGAAVEAARPPVYILARARASGDYWDGWGRGLGVVGDARVVAVGERDAEYLLGRLRSGLDAASGRVFPSLSAAREAAGAPG